MDPFTQRMLERAKTRREKLDNQKIALGQKSPLQEKNKLISANFTDEPKENATDNNRKKQYITPFRKSKLQKLAQLYSSNDENLILEVEEVEEEKAEIVTSDVEKKNQCKLKRLNELATKIKQWEDDTGHSKSNTQRTINVNVKKDHSNKSVVNDGQAIWDSDMVEKLCSQGFARSESQSKLLYSFDSKKEKLQEKPNKNSESNIKPPVSFQKDEKTPPVRRNEVLKKAAFFESTTRESPNKPATRDPAELSLAERKALFERNKGEAVLPKNVFISEKKPTVKIIDCEKKENKMNENLECIRLKQDGKIEEKKNFYEEKTKQQSVGGLEEVKPTIPQPPQMTVLNQKNETVENKKDEKEDQWTIGGRLYPSLSDLDLTAESEMTPSHTDSLNESKNSNLCLNMTLSDLLEMSKNNPVTPPADQSFSKSKECQVLDKMDKLLEDALNNLSSSEGENDVIPSPPKMMRSSSFEYKSGRDDGNPLLHTVSFYRKQQKDSCVSQNEETNGKEIILDESQPEEEPDESVLVQNKIQVLLTEVSKQQTIISQASQALNLCLSTVEFSGSGEQVEGERLLLLASQKRQACLNEIQRLKIENTLRPKGGNAFLTERGDVRIRNISVKLKRDALRSIAAAENLQYFVCLVKSDEQVLATPVISATKENLKEMALQFPGLIKLQDLLSNFKITVEVYNLELGKELLPHDVKYHIVNKKEKKLLTPIKSKKLESKLVKPHIQSPAGPNAVRTSNFNMCGYIVFSLREISRTQWILNKVPYISPLEGTICMNIQSELHLNDEFRGFLTMFDDISGFGAWHRRWCLLASHFISYWKYPDDEQKKVPIGTIDLKSVITENVGLVSRDICARLNTFLIETTRSRLPEDKNSLVVRVSDDVTTIRHLLSADSKQEMTTWCKKLNSTLALLRSWKCNFNE